MNLLDLINSPWAIDPSKLGEIQSVYITHMRGEKIDLAALEASLGRPLAREQQGYEVRDHVAIIPVDGVIAQKANLFSRISGGASSQLIERDIRGALADPLVRAIVLDINSPGGTVFGTQELAMHVDAARGEKPIAAFASGQMASAAYWIGSAADRVYISGDNVLVGSIGVVASHVDRSAADAKSGLTVTEIVAGKYKRIAGENAPLTPEGRAHMQDMVDYLYSVFVGDVAAFRHVSVDQALAGMADGRVFIGRQAIDAGLVDGVSTLDDLVAMLGSGSMPRRAMTRKPAALRVISTGGAPAEPAPAPATAAATDAEAGGGGPQAEAQPISIEKGPNMEVKDITREFLLANCAALVTALRAEGAAAELQRIKDVEAVALPGHEQLVATLKFDGKTTGGEAALQVLAAEKGKLGTKAADLHADASLLNRAAPEAAGDPAGAAAAAQAEEDKLPVDQRAKAKWEKDPVLRAEFADQFDAYLAFEKNKANVRILGKRAA